MPRGTALNFWAYVDVLTHPSWLGVLLCMITLAAALHTLSHNSAELPMMRSVALQCAMLLQKSSAGADLGDRLAWPARLVYQSSGMFAFLVFAVYSAVLTSLMTSGYHTNTLYRYSYNTDNDTQDILVLVLLQYLLLPWQTCPHHPTPTTPSSFRQAPPTTPLSRMPRRAQHSTSFTNASSREKRVML